LAERQRVVSLIQEAIQSGARQLQACEVLELSSRTYQRWIKTGVVSDGRITTKRPPPVNRLSDEERQQILAVCNTPVYAHLPPYQIVPRLADQGIYLASESSFYRILKAANQLTPTLLLLALFKNNLHSLVTIPETIAIMASGKEISGSISETK
jgi:putative transposase